MDNKKDNRINAYLKEEDILLLNAIREEINHDKRVSCDVYKNNTGFVKTYKPVGNSELISQLLKKYRDNTRNAYTEKLDYHSKRAEYYENKLKIMNTKDRDDILESEVRA